MQDIRAITLDLDDTLWAIGPVIAKAEAALRDWFAEHYPRIPERFDRRAALELRSEVMAEYIGRAHDLTFLRREVIARMASAAGYVEIDIDAAFSVFDAARNDLELFPDVRPALTSLHARYRLIAVTNGNARLDKIGIGDLFDGFVTARSVGAAKPARPIFDAAVEAGGAPASQTLHVGDHPELDVDGARAAGLKAVWINREGFSWPEEFDAPDEVINDLHELDRLLPRSVAG